MTVDPLSLATLTAIVTILGTLATQWITARFSEQSRIASLEAANAILQEQNLTMKTCHVEEVEKLQLENTNLRAYINEHLSRESLRKSYTLHKNGTYVKDGRHFCFTCFEGNSPPIISPIAWRDTCDCCVHCGKKVG